MAVKKTKAESNAGVQGKTVKKVASAPKKSAAKPATMSKPKSATKGKVIKPTKQSDALAMVQALCATYPDACCELTFDSDFQLLIAVILSAQCTDQTVNRVTKGLFAEFPTAVSLAGADLERIKVLVKQTGFFNAKARNIQACAQAIVERFGGKVPETVEELTTLPGVGRKTANVVLGVVHNVPGWTVDTHVQRLSKRLGFTSQDDPLKIEYDLQKLFPKEDWTKLSITIIWHGRRLCYARKPDCKGCPINKLCPSSEA